ncbi:MAG: type I glyceraldehyde-3-phosphate dehydrogenase [Candidatus Levybacteria bacterium]|nr:type I glyceraldehyde-3-phosphate dehydrogenase [Candidatus Levybacteria bacterium]MBI3092731.1 type I glyceraldehyde-3-phosphate dehydrogenase [Candidatus Levybacteria bacterium]
MMVRLAINGYGRIGRVAHRVILEKFSSEVDVVAINASSSTDIKGWMYLLKYDTVYGPLKSEIRSAKFETNSNDQNTKSETNPIGTLIIDGKDVAVFSEKDPNKLPWKLLGIDVVIESSGVFRKEGDLKKHLEAGARAVVLSAPVKDPSAGSGQVPTYVFSVNQKNYQGEKIISNASCTTNCITPVAKIILDNFGIEKAMMTTIHGYTSDQRLQDGGHKDYRRARAAAQNIIPTSTGATIAATKALPELLDNFTGLAIRVPVITGSLSDFTFLIKRNSTTEEINEVFKKAAKHPQYRGILTVTEDPLVSSDIIGNPHSAIVDLSLTQVVAGNLVKVIAWYDNEWGYANRLVEEALMIGKHG